MTRAQVNRTLAAIVGLGAAARIVAWRSSPGAIHPDEIFQVLEPAWWHLTGVGQAAWEWRDGVRSWVLPSYNGAWMAALMALGIRRGATIGAFLQLHWALLNLLLVGAAFRGGTFVAARLEARRPSIPVDPVADPAAPGSRGGLVAAGLCALFPLVVSYAPHSLSEMPSMLALVGGLAMTADLIEQPRPRAGRAFLIGVVLSFGICVRIANGPLVLVAPIWLLLRRRWAGFALVVAGALVPIIVFGLVDLLTWGKFLGSFIGYIKFNFIEGRAAQFGTEPWFWYVLRIHERAPWGLALLLVPLVLGLRATWPFAISAFGLVAMLSTQAHKEERFIIAFWPFALIGAGGVMGAWLSARNSTRAGWRGWLGRRWVHVLCGAMIAIVLLDDLRHPIAGDLSHPRPRMAALASIGDDPSVSGLLVDSIFFWGGSIWFGQKVPQINFDPALLNNPLFTHVLTTEGSGADQQARQAGFVPRSLGQGMLVLHRP
jgi:phosphatidylinositol glycan class B